MAMKQEKELQWKPGEKKQNLYIYMSKYKDISAIKVKVKTDE